MTTPRLVSGIQPSGRLHIGNYLGVLQNLVRLQREGSYDCFYFLADLHSLTESYTPEEKREQIISVAVDFLAAGIDPERVVMFQQSAVESHTVLSWIFSTLTPMGELRRMTQFKDKSGGADESSATVNVGLFTYPVLMAADILIYNPAFVPVGHDQLQHLELTRTIARKFNGRFGETFVEPQPLLTKAARIMSLDNPTKKMSKSIPSSCLFIDDAPDVVFEKLKGAVTDSGHEIRFDEEGKPAISNLLAIAAGISGKTIADLEKDFSGLSYVDFKKAVAQIIVDELAPYRKRKQELLQDPGYIGAILAAGAEKAEEVAAQKLDEVKQAIGLDLGF